MLRNADVILVLTVFIIVGGYRNLKQAVIIWYKNTIEGSAESYKCS